MKKKLDNRHDYEAMSIGLGGIVFKLGTSQDSKGTPTPFLDIINAATGEMHGPVTGASAIGAFKAIVAHLEG